MRGLNTFAGNMQTQNFLRNRAASSPSGLRVGGSSRAGRFAAARRAAAMSGSPAA